MRPIPRPILLSAALLAALGVAHRAWSHPHVFAEARLDIVAGTDGAVQAVRHLWRFDEIWSSGEVLLTFDQNLDLELDGAELAEVARTVNESIAEFGYFQFVTADGREVAMLPPENLVADYQDDRLIILFESRPKDTLMLSGKLSFGVYDPTFYTAIEFLQDDHMAVENLPDGCTRTVVRPDPEEAIAQNQESLTDAFFDDPQANDPSKFFATRLELTCQG